MPQRIQLSRRKGWKKPEGTIAVARPSRWGNPYRLVVYEVDYPVGSGYDEHTWRKYAVSDFRGMLEGKWGEDLDYATPADIREALAGHDLACWCPLDEPCHADVLLEVANS